MELPRLLDELTYAAERVGIVVRTEPFDPHLSDARRPRGGLCTVLGRRLILIDANASLPDRIATIAAALAQVDLEAVYVPPIVRATIGAYARPPQAVDIRGSGSGRAGPEPRAPRAEPAVTPLPLARTRWPKDR